MDPSALAPRPCDTPLPPQARGRRRREEILSAAIRLIDQQGYRQVTVRGIAAASGTSPATIYHYFPDLESVVAAAASRFLDRVNASISEVLDGPGTTADRFVTDTVAAFRAVFAGHPGLRELWFSRHATPTVVAIHTRYRDSLAEAMRRKAAAVVSEPGEVLRYRIALEASGALWELAFALDPDGDEYVLREIRRRILGLLGPAASPAPADTSCRPRDEASRDAAVARLEASLASGPRPWATPLPPQARGRARRTAILDAATTVLDEHGPHGDAVSARAVADRAKVPPASIYQYFDDMDGLAAGVVVRYSEQLLDILDLPGTGHDERVRAVVDAYRSHFVAHPGLRRLWFDRHASDAVRAVHRHYQLAAARALRAAHPEARADLLDHVMVMAQVDAQWDFAFALDDEGHPLVVQEIVDLVLDAV